MGQSGLQLHYTGEWILLMRQFFMGCLLIFSCTVKTAYALDETQLAVWANEAIVATYTFDDKNFLARQKVIATYFNAQGWINYSTALNASGLPASIQQNHYAVSAVALLPPTVTVIATERWQAVMPLMVLYQNDSLQQKQTLQVTITFGKAPDGQGVRGLALYSLQATTVTPPCECQPSEPTTTSATPLPSNAAPIKTQ